MRWHNGNLGTQFNCSDITMILALFTFCLSLVQILIGKEILSARTRFNFYLVVASLSAIPVLLQLLALVTEMVKAGRYCIKLVMHKFILNLTGEYGAQSTLLLRQAIRIPYGDYPGARGVFKIVLYMGHPIVRLLGGAGFGDAFSGQYQIRYTSFALWMDNHRQSWRGRVEPPVKDIPADAFDGSVVIRGVFLNYQFRPLQGPMTEEDLEIGRPGSAGPHYYRYKIFATGSSDGPGSKLYMEKFAKLSCSRESAIEFCKTMDTLDNDTFFVVGPVLKGNDQTFRCLDLKNIIESLLKDNKKVNCRRVYGAKYV